MALLFAALIAILQAPATTVAPLDPRWSIPFDTPPVAAAGFDATTAYVPLKGGQLVAVDLDSGGIRFLVWRNQEGCRFEHLDIGSFAFFGAGARRATLEEAAEAAFAADPEFDLVAALAIHRRCLVLAETLGSTASNLCLDTGRFYAVGQEINANHLRSARFGRVTGTARALHLGSRTHVWDIQLEDESGRLTCVSRLTMAVIDAPGKGMVLLAPEQS